MRYHVLACDYDGTLAHHGRVAPETLAALERLKRSGRRFVLVTGRQLDDLLAVFPGIDICERVVAENGAVLYDPATRDQRVLADPPPHTFVQALHERGVEATAGRVVVATHEPHENEVLATIRDLGLELQLFFNKGAVMVLPSGINKATGLAAALAELKLSLHNAVAAGDAENDHAFMTACEANVAVANALPIIREYADWVTPGDHGAGVADLIDHLLETDLAELEPRLRRHNLALGRAGDGAEVRVPPYGTSLLLSGTSGSGKSTFATAFTERLFEHRYQYCVIDPEGDYENLETAKVLGDAKHVPTFDEIIELLDDPDENLVVNLLGVARPHRPAFFQSLLSVLVEMRARTGRPHWIVIDETHHLLPAGWEGADAALPQRLGGLLLITVHPDHVARVILAAVDTVIAVGAEPKKTVSEFCAALGRPCAMLPPGPLPSGEAIVWSPADGAAPSRFRSIPPQAERRRHRRKYAEGNLGDDRSFYFRGRDGRLNLRAQNLMLFLQLADGIDDDTWLYHLRRRDYSTWFREAIKDPVLAEAAVRIESMPRVSPRESRSLIRDAVEARYMLPA